MRFIIICRMVGLRCRFIRCEGADFKICLVVSHLSTGEHAVAEEVFQNILQYIFTFIDKVLTLLSLFVLILILNNQEKQAESIVEKLCQRFRLSEDPRQWRDLAYCLSLLPFKSERSVKKLIEGLQSYRDKLHEPGVYNRFTEILVKVCRSPSLRISNRKVLMAVCRRGATSRRINLTLSWMSLRRCGRITYFNL
jgi:hypothetical protein